MSNEKMYAADCEFTGSCVGTLEDVYEWIVENDVNIVNCNVWELGEKCKLTIKVEKSNEQ